MSTFDPNLAATRRSNRRGARVILNPLLRIEGETLTYAALSTRLCCSENEVREAVRRARGLKAGLTWQTLTRYCSLSTAE